MLNKDIAIVLFFVLACVGLFFVPSGFEGAVAEDAIHARAKVLSVENVDLQTLSVIKVGTQFLQAKLLSGPDKGRVIRVNNQLMGRMETDEIYKAGEKLLVEYRDRGEKTMGFARGHYRLHLEVLLAIGFGIFLVVIAGWTGAKALLSFIFAALMLWKVMIPCFLKGVDPLWISIIVVAMLTASVSFLVGGLSRKGVITFLGSFSGLILACVLANVFSAGFEINGAVRPYAETLLYSGFGHLDLTKIFVCGVFIACSGAVMDLAMDIAASMDEILQKRPDIGFVEHVWSGLCVGRSVIGTMTTTLLLAYSGGYTTMLMFYMGQGTPLQQFFNQNLIAAEVLNIFVGSFGLVAVAPFTALLAGFVYHFQFEKAKEVKWSFSKI